MLVDRTTGGDEVAADQGVRFAASSQEEVNKLFRADFFGERALLKDEPRGATVVVVGHTPLRCLTLTREVFTEYLGPLQVKRLLLRLSARWVQERQPWCG